MKTTFLFILNLTLFAGTGLAGAGSSGGGASVVCRDITGKIERAELLDLYEARVKYGLEIKSGQGTLEQEYWSYTRLVNQISGFGMPKMKDVLNYLDHNFLTIINFLPSGITLNLHHDIGNLTYQLPTGCKLEQLAIYYDRPNRLDIDSEIWNAMTPINQAALLAHEEIYLNYRGLN